MPPFVKIQKQRKPGKGEKVDPKCQGSGRVDTHVCMTCHGSGVVPDKGKSNGGNGS